MPMGLADWFLRTFATPVESEKAVASPPPERKFSGPFYPVGIAAPYSPAPVYGPATAEALRLTYGGTYATNSAVVACITAIQRTYVEAPVVAYRLLPDGKREPVVPFPATDLLDRPNPAMTANLVMAYVQYCKSVYGNAYLRKIRNGGGQVVQLWPLSPAVTWPVREHRSTNFIDYYAYQFGPNGSAQERIPVEDIVHFRMGLDDRNMMLGLSPLAQLAREVDTDEQTTAFSDRLVRNNAVPGLVVTLPVDAGDPGRDVAEQIKQSINRTFQGEGQGDTAVLHGGAKAEQFGFNPQQLDLTSLHRLPEERISAVLGVPAIIAGLGAGLDRATYANFKEAREMFIESTIIPSYSEDDAVLNQQLLPEFTDDPSVVLRHDITDMRALQPDIDAQYNRLTVAVGGPWLAANEARSETGFPPDTDAGSDLIGGAPPPPPPVSVATVPIPTAAPAARALDAAATKALNPTDFERSMLALRAAHEASLTAVLTTFFAGQARRVAARYREAS
jgi:HK97 family phage portal protein